MLLQGRRNGPPGTPTAFETKFGRVLTGKTDNLKVPSNVAAITMQSHSLVTTFSASSGKLKNAQEMSQITHQKNALLFIILLKPTRKEKMVDLSYHFQKTLGQNLLESQDHLLYTDSSLSLSSDLSTQRINLMNLLLS